MMSVHLLSPCGQLSGIPSSNVQQQSEQIHAHSPRAARSVNSLKIEFITENNFSVSEHVETKIPVIIQPCFHLAPTSNNHYQNNRQLEIL